MKFHFSCSDLRARNSKKVHAWSAACRFVFGIRFCMKNLAHDRNDSENLKLLFAQMDVEGIGKNQTCLTIVGMFTLGQSGSRLHSTCNESTETMSSLTPGRSGKIICASHRAATRESLGGRTNFAAIKFAASQKYALQRECTPQATKLMSLHQQDSKKRSGPKVWRLVSSSEPAH